MKTFKDVYQFPLEDTSHIGYIYDQKRNFVFQFIIEDDEIQDAMLKVINGNSILKRPKPIFRHEDGIITGNDGIDYILIRGWGNLTGVGAMNLSSDEATNIQNSFAEYIIEQLNKR